jgi:hypothetical protein
MTAVEVIERDKQLAKKAFINPIISLEDELPPLLTGPIVSLEDKLPPPSTAPAIVEGSRKRPRKYTTIYREAFRDLQEDPTAGIKRGKAGGIL